ncbi:hypothetical protein [Staphylococcus hyicus]|uniref:hypothetical protein n=1 Tax=Staphylococcus hyicus TaxID=1284 RepID=UPI003132DA7C
MDSKIEAIEYFKKSNLKFLDEDHYDTKYGLEEIKNNPLTTVIYEILYLEVVEPILESIKLDLCNTDMFFRYFEDYEETDSLKLVFSDPYFECNSNEDPTKIGELLLKKIDEELTV